METWWRIELFDGLRARSGETVLTRFYSQKTGNLLAYLALYSRRAHAREALAEQFWPEAAPDAGRLNLRVALAALRRQLEPPGVPNGSVLIATRTTIRLNTDHVTTDVAEFQSALRAADGATEQEARIALLEQADLLAQGELLPGCYEEWALGERRRLHDLQAQALQSLRAAWEQCGDLPRALDYAHRALAIDAFHEANHYHLIRLHLANGQPMAARRQYQELERILREEFATTPSEAALALAEQAHATVGGATKDVPLEAPAPPRRKQRDAENAPLSASSRSDADPQLPRMPTLFTRFFGREAELEELQSLLRPARSPLPACLQADSGQEMPQCVTLTGLGGTGKTRLALEAGHRLTLDYAGAVVFVSLAEVTTASKIVDAVLAALPQERSADRAAFEQVAEILTFRPTLLILDNFEQLLTPPQARESVAKVLRLRERCPMLACLITSRQPLHIEGERELTLGPLPTPPGPDTPERLLRFAGVRLFVDRARLARADFQITPRNADAVTALCRRLEGSPLALELAATWARALTPTQMLARLADRFEMLVSRRRDIPERHRTLRAAIDWSFQALTPEQQRCFLRMSLFRGGWTLEAAEAVCGAEPTDTYDALLSLCERSLIVSQEGKDETRRFSMLESLREYAAEQREPAERQAAVEAHARYYAEWAVRAHDHFSQSDSAVWMDRLEEDHENLQTALDWAIGGGDLDLGVGMVLHLDWFWITRGFREERLRRLEQVRASLEAIGPELRASALLWIGHFLKPSEARALYERCLQMCQEQNNLAGIADTLYALATIAAGERNDKEANRLFAESLRRHRAVGSVRGVNAARAALAASYRGQGDYIGAQTLLQEQLADLDTQGNVDGVAKVRLALANLALEQGDYEHATTLLERSLETYRALGQRWGLADALRNLGNVRSAQGAYAEGETCLRESLAMFRAINEERMVGSLLLDLAEQAWERRDTPGGAALIAECLPWAEGHFQSDERVRLHGLQGALALTEGRLDAAEDLFDLALRGRPDYDASSALVRLHHHVACLHLSRGAGDRARRSLQATLLGASEMGLKPCQLRALATLAEWLAVSGQAQEAAAVLGAVVSLSALLRIPPSPREAAYRERVQATLSERLSPETLALAWQSRAQEELSALVAQGLKTLR